MAPGIFSRFGKRKKPNPQFENHHLPRMIFDRQNLLFLSANKAARDLYGYTIDEFRCLTIKEIRPAWELQKLERHLNEQALYGNNTGNWKHLTKDGNVMLVRIKAEDTMFEGKLQRLVTVENITPVRPAV